ncbi:ferritin [Corynebacterium epidermidicanis]|uniref:Ferritin n=1 Tax=Corynebacterium epidermidicanis TaxID=1050174 RepID=A0A0G3GYE1_9CORY|nr:ferritin [Corynebacterium epidermidicanis]AKK03872.1 ferritin-like protein [Corynebacterium epidermidicanis]
MTLNQKLQSALNNQVTAELEAALIYLQLSYIVDDLGLTGMRDWLRIQSNEELTHAQLFADHLSARNVTPTIQAIAAPAQPERTAVAVFEAALAHEEKISDLIRNLAAIVDEVRDYDARPLIDSFLAEQIEEVSTVREILDRIRIVGSDGSGLLRIDAELGTRVNTD